MTEIRRIKRALYLDDFKKKYMFAVRNSSRLTFILSKCEADCPTVNLWAVVRRPFSLNGG